MNQYVPNGQNFRLAMCRDFFLRPTATVAVVLALCAGCTTSHAPDSGGSPQGAARLESAVAWLSAPKAVLEANAGSELTGRRLLRCYETEMTDPVLQSTAVMVKLTITDGGNLRGEIVSSRTGLSQAFSDCVDTVIQQTDYKVDAGSETILPLEFGPRQQ